jgi:hypothetical protein
MFYLKQKIGGNVQKEINMLVIENIERLKNKTIGAWRVMGTDENSYFNMTTPHYSITIDRNGITAGIVIERTEGEHGYNVSLCYEMCDNVIAINAVGKNELKNKDIFLSLMRGILDAEYDNQQLI